MQRATSRLRCLAFACLVLASNLLFAVRKRFWIPLVKSRPRASAISVPNTQNEAPVSTLAATGTWIAPERSTTGLTMPSSSPE